MDRNTLGVAAEIFPALTKTGGSRVLRDVEPGTHGPREPIKEFLREIPRLDRLGKLLCDFGFRQEHFDIHSGLMLPAWTEWHPTRKRGTVRGAWLLARIELACAQ